MLYRRILLGTTALTLFASGALAADNATLITPCAVGCVTVRSIDTTGSGGPMVPVVALGSTTGAAIATIAGTPNTTSVLSVQGTTGGTTLPVTASAGTNLNTSLLALEAGGNLALIKADTDRLLSSATRITPGSALATTSFVIGSRYVATPPTFTDGQEGAFQIDANGRLLVTSAGTVTATLSAETTKVIGTVNQGTSPWVVSGTVTANATLAAETVKVIGAVNQGTSPWVTTANAGTNLNTSLLALEAGGNLATIQTWTSRLGTSATNITPGGSVATSAFVIGTRYLSTPPTFTNTQEGAFQIDANGRMLTSSRMTGNIGGVLDAVVAATYPANALAVGVLNGANIGRLVGDETNGLWVNIKAGAGSGGTALADAGTFTLTSTNMTPAGCTFNSGSLTLTTGTAGALSCTAGRSLHTTVDTLTNWAGTALGVPTAYGTAPTTGNYIGVNAFVTNSTTALPDNVDGVAAVSTASNSPTNAINYVFNGTTFDRLRSGTTTGSALINGAGTAGSAAGGVLTIQGVASMTPVFTNTAQVNGVTVLTGTGATGTGAQRVTVSTDQATNAGAALVKGGVGVVNGGSTYQHVAASQTAAVLQTSTGATGDYLSHCVIYPSTTAAASVTVFDNTNAAGTNVIEFSTGTLSNLVPIVIPVGAVSTAGAWKVTTGANETVVCYGKFS